MVQFTIIDNAVASHKTRASNTYKDILSKLTISTKNEDGLLAGKGVALEKPGQVLALRAAAKEQGFAIVTRKHTEGDHKGKYVCQKINASDVPVRKNHKKATKKA